MLIPLHVKSYYSLGRGTASLETLVERAAAGGLPALALTDRDSLAGQMHFHALCLRHNVRPITGIELEVAPAARIVLLARNEDGYRNLCRLIARRRGAAGSDEQQKAARDPVAAVAAHAEGLFVLTDDGPTLERLCRARSIDHKRLRGLLVRPCSEARQRQLLEAAAARRVAVVADPEVLLLDRQDEPVHLLQRAIAEQVPVAKLAEDPDHELERWMRSPGANDELFADVPRALEEANRVASRCELELCPPERLLPGADAFGGQQPEAELARRCRRALEEARRGGRCRQEAYGDRLNSELDTIQGLGYASYFLAAAELAAEAQRRAIPIALRGSAAGSLAVHLLGISEIDPLARGLYFERFLHSGRQRPPDIALEVSSTRRDELIRWAYRRFGRERVTMAGVYQRFRVASAFREGLKALGASRNDIARFAAELARRGLESGPGAELAGTHELAPDGDTKVDEEGAADPGDLPLTLLPAAQRSAASALLRLVGLPRRLALHPGALLIGSEPLETRLPIERASKQLTVTQFDLRSLEAAGTAKLDILGNRFLSQLAETLTLAGHRPPAGVAWGTDLPLDDAATLTRIDHGDTVGCHRIEAPSVRALLAQLPVRRLEDLVAALALVRHGTAADTQRRYIRQLREPPGPQALQPLIGERLRETHGLVLYDEDLMSVLSALADISLAAADEIRSAIVDADADAGALDRLEEQFAELAARRGADSELVRVTWRTITPFASYTVCKAHAWSVALLAYRAAYLKTHYPEALTCALLNDYAGAYPLRTIAAEMARAGVRILLPSANASGLETILERDAHGEPVGVRIGLDKLKHLTRKRAETLNAESRRRRFTDMSDLLSRVTLSRRELRALVLSGACDGLPPLSANDYPFAHERLLEMGLAAGPRASGDGAMDAEGRRELERYAGLVRTRNELELLGMYLSDHPMRLLRDDAARHGCVTSAEIRAPAAERMRDTVRFAGIVAASRRHRSAAARAPTLFLTLEDEHGLLEAVIASSSYSRLAPALTTPGPYLVEGTRKDDRGHVFLDVTALLPFQERSAAQSGLARAQVGG